MTHLSFRQAQDYDRDGFVVVEDVFSATEIESLLKTLDDDGVKGYNAEIKDAQGETNKLVVWTDVPDTPFGALSVDPRLVNCARMLIREDVYHWHSKVMMKMPGTTGKWEWHQDYGYWYDDGCPYPRMLSAMVALDHATRENGCLKVLVGSHLLGRINHSSVGDQAGADGERLKAIEETLEVRYLEARPGSVIFFHCNTLHSSEPNLSTSPRRVMISSYNALSNVPLRGRGHGKPVPITEAAGA